MKDIVTYIIFLVVVFAFLSSCALFMDKYFPGYFKSDPNVEDLSDYE